MDQIQKIARKMATSNVLRTMASPERSEQLLTSIRALSDNALDAMAALDGIPEEQYPIFRAHIRGEPNPFWRRSAQLTGSFERVM